jgi:hypothetical protein
MSLRLKALCAAEGTGIVWLGGRLRLLRPPYTLTNSPILPEESIEEAILRHGFTAADQEFATWNEVINFLNQQVVEARHELGDNIPESIPGADIMDVAPEEVLRDFMDRVERDLIPRAKYAHAENILFALLTSKASTRYPILGEKAVDLLRRNRAACARANTGLSELAKRDVRFKSLEKHGQLKKSEKRAEEITRWGCIFAPCS